MDGGNTQAVKPAAGNFPNTKFPSDINRSDPLGSAVVLLKSLFQAAPSSILTYCNISTVLPALVYAASAILVGVVLSAFLNILVTSILPYWIEVNAISLWRYCFLGGVGLRLGADIPSLGAISAGLSLNGWFLSLLIIPAVSLLAARAARSAFIKKKFSGKVTSLADSAACAISFAVINAALFLLPFSMESSIKRVIISKLSKELGELPGEIANVITFNMSSRAFGAFWMALILGFLFVLPYRQLLIRLTTKSNDIIDSFMIAILHLRRMLLAAIIVSLCLVVFLLPRFDNVTSSIVLYLLTALPNMVVCVLSLLSGGVLRAKLAIPSELAEVIERFTSYNLTTNLSLLSSVTGILAIIICVMIAAVSLYPTLRNERRFLQKCVAITVIYAFMACVLSMFAGFAISGSGSYSVFSSQGSLNLTASLTIAAFGVFFTAALITVMAAVTIYYAGRFTALDNVLKSIATRRNYAMIFTALASIVIAIILNRLLAVFLSKIHL